LDELREIYRSLRRSRLFLVALAMLLVYFAWALTWTVFWLLFATEQNWETRYTAASFWIGVGGFGLALVLGLVVIGQVVRSLEKPKLVVGFAEGKRACTLQVSDQPFSLGFRVTNEGGQVGIWFKVTVDLSALPMQPYDVLEADWDERRQYIRLEQDIQQALILESKGQIGAFPESPLGMGKLMFRATAEDLARMGDQPRTYKLPYRIHGDWGKSEHGELVAKLLPPAPPRDIDE
jgi:hypothetical protein